MIQALRAKSSNLVSLFYIHIGYNHKAENRALLFVREGGRG